MEDGNQIYLLQPYSQYDDIRLDGVVLAHDAILIGWEDYDSPVEIYVDNDHTKDAILKANKGGEPCFYPMTVRDARIISQTDRKNICLNIRGPETGPIMRYNNPQLFSHMQAIASFQAFIQAGADRPKFKDREIVTVSSLAEGLPLTSGTLKSGRACSVFTTSAISLG